MEDVRNLRMTYRSVCEELEKRPLLQDFARSYHRQQLISCLKQLLDNRKKGAEIRSLWENLSTPERLEPMLNSVAHVPTYLRSGQSITRRLTIQISD